MKPTSIVQEFYNHNGWDRIKGSFVTPSWCKSEDGRVTCAKTESIFANVEITDYLAILRETGLYPLWMPGCKEARTIRRVKPQETIALIRFDDFEFCVRARFEIHADLGCISASIQSTEEDGVDVTDRTGFMNWNMLIRPLPDSHVKVQSVMAFDLQPRLEIDHEDRLSPAKFLEETVSHLFDIAAENASDNVLNHLALMAQDPAFYEGFLAPGVRSLSTLVAPGIASSTSGASAYTPRKQSISGAAPVRASNGSITRSSRPSFSSVHGANTPRATIEAEYSMYSSGGTSALLPGGSGQDMCKCPIKQHAPLVAPVDVPYSQAVVTYKTLIWGWMWVSLILFTVDRFWWDVWPMWVSRPLPDSDKTTTPVNIFLLWAWGSGRASIITTFFLFLTQCRVTMNYVAQNAPCWLYVGDIHQINNDLHWFLGILTGVAITIHVWIIFLPAMVDGTKMNVLPTQQERKKVDFYDAETETLNLAPDDVWRLLEMTMMFGLFFPYSMASAFKSGRQQRYTFSMLIHLVAGLGFAVDIIRKESHPHSHRINVPMVLYWIMDRAVGLFLYRVNTATIAAMDELEDGRYMIVYLKFEGTKEERAKIPEGEYVYLQMEGMQFDYAHPFTVFRNRGPLSGMRNGRPKKVTYEKEDETSIVFKRMPSESNIQYDAASSGAIPHEGLPNTFGEGKTKTSVWHSKSRRNSAVTEASDDSLGDEGAIEAAAEGGAKRGQLQKLASMTSIKVSKGQVETLPDYDFAAIVEVHRTEIDHAGVLMRKPWTATLRDAHMEDKLVSLRCYGPYHAVFADLRSHCFTLPPMLFVATGGGAAPVLDFHQHVVHNKLRLRRPVMVLYSCNSPALFAYVTSILFSTRIPNFYVRGFITNSANRKVSMEYSPFEARTEASWQRDIVGLNERMALDYEMEDAKSLGITDVYFCGAPTVGANVQENCKMLGLEYHMGHTFG